MKSLCKSLMLSLMLGIAALMPSGLMAQSQPEPTIVVSISNFDEQMKDVKYLLEASGFKEMNFIVSAAIKGYTKGIDKDRNAGVMMFFGEEPGAPDFLGFVPVKDIDDMLDVVSGMAEVEEEGDMYVIVSPNGDEVMVKEQSGYAFFSMKESLLKELPEDPEAVLGDLPSKFNVAAKVMPQRLPKALKIQIMQMIEEGSEQALENLDDGAQSDLQRKNMELQMEQLDMLMDETEEMTMGIAIDKASKSLFMDVVFKGVAGSKLANKMAASKPTAPSRFSGFLMEGAAMTMNSNSRMNPTDADTYAGMLDDVKGTLLEEMQDETEFSEDELDDLEEAVGSIFEVVKKTLKEGVFDAGAVIMLEGKEINFAGGMQVADPMAVQRTIKNLVPMIEERAGDKLSIKLDTRKYKGVNFHEIVIPVPEDEEEVSKAFGEEIKVILGMGNKALYVGAGTSPQKLLKRAMDETHPAVELQQFNFYLAPVLRMAGRMDAPPQVDLMAEQLEKSGKDRISAVTNVIENGVHTRFEVQDGILALIKVGFDAAQAGGFPEDDF